MTYTETLEYIHSLGMFSLPAGLHRITEALKRLGDPQRDFKAVHIAGTNGKGSTAAFIAESLKAAGLKTGLFTSPYIIEFCERIRINGEFIPEADLIRLSERVKAAGVELTEFEFITAVCFLYFSETGVDIAVIEVGLGGRLDATNSLPPPAASVITKIGLDHTAILGDTLPLIAAEKCGILKGGLCVTAPNQEPEALDVIKGRALELVIPALSSLEIISENISGNEFIYKGKRYKTRLAGRHQIYNAITAIETLHTLGIPQSAAFKGISEAFLPARLEIISEAPLIILDGAHNPDGADTLAAAIRNLSCEITAIVGMVKDKDCKEVLGKLLPMCSRAIAVKAADIPRALEAVELAALAAEYCGEVQAAKNYAQALEAAKGAKATLIFGSLYLASGIRPLLF